MECMRRADELCCIQTSFVHPLNFQESLVRPGMHIFVLATSGCQSCLSCALVLPHAASTLALCAPPASPGVPGSESLAPSGACAELWDLVMSGSQAHS